MPFAQALLVPFFFLLIIHNNFIKLYENKYNMNIGMIAWSYYPRQGGSTTTVSHLTQALKEKGIKSEIICPDINKFGIFNEKGIRVHRVGNSLTKNFTKNKDRLIFLNLLRRKIKQLSKNIDIFHSHDFNIGTAAGILGKKNRPLCAVYGADMTFEYVNYNRKKPLSYSEVIKLKNPKTIILNKIQKELIKKTDKIIMISPSLKKDILHYYKNANLTYIPCGINIKKFENSRFNKNNKKILMVTRFVSWKNIDGAIKIYNLVKQKHNAAIMTIIGTGPLINYYSY